MPVTETVEEITPEWLEAVLRGAGARIAGHVAAIQSTRIGAEIGFLSQTARIAVTYDGGRGDAPETVVVKLEPSAGQYRTAERGLKAFEREIRFYREIAPRVALRLPRVFHAAVTADASLLVMEDLSHLRFADQVHGLRQAEVMSTVREVAKLHAAFWGATAGPRTARLVDCQAERIFASALELDAATALE